MRSPGRALFQLRISVVRERHVEMSGEACSVISYWRDVARHTFKDLTSFGLLFDTPFASTNIGIALPPLGYTNIRGAGADVKLGAWEGVGSSSECPFEMTDSEFGFEAES